MPGGMVTVLGGMPVWAEVWFSGPDYQGEYDAGVDSLHWLTRKNGRGKPVTQAFMDRVEKRDPYWQASVVEQINENAMAEHYAAREDSRDDFRFTFD